MQGRKLRSPFSVRKLGVTENLDKLLEGGGHDNLVIVTINNILENGGEECESLWRLGADDLRRAEVRKLAIERSSVLDTTRVIQSQYTEDVTSLNKDHVVQSQVFSVEYIGLLPVERGERWVMVIVQPSRLC